jgi:hypothetical protein
MPALWRSKAKAGRSLYTPISWKKRKSLGHRELAERELLSASRHALHIMIGSRNQSINNKTFSRMENKITGMQATGADAHQQQAIVVTEIDQSIVVVVDRLKIELVEIGNVKMIKFDKVRVSGLLREIEEHLLAHPWCKYKGIIGRASSRKSDGLQGRSSGMTIADRDVVSLCNGMAGGWV